MNEELLKSVIDSRLGIKERSFREGSIPSCYIQVDIVASEGSCSTQRMTSVH